MFSLQADPRVKALKEFFYNEISGKALMMEGDINPINVDVRIEKAIQLLIAEVLQNSADLSDSFRLYEGFALHQGNCPLMYLSFFKALMVLKTAHSASLPNALSERLMNAPGFKEMFPKLKAFLLGKADAKKLKDFFYNRLNELASFQDEINEQNIDAILKELVQSLIKEVLDASRGQGATIRFGYEQINEDNCPTVYLDLYRAMAGINQRSHNLDDFTMNKNIELIANELVNSTAFKLMLPKLKEFILEIRVPQEPHQSAVNANRRVPAAQNINIQAIRDTFYLHMNEQIQSALEEGLITREDLESEEPYLYMGLPGLALLAALNESSECVGGLLLANGAVVDKHNCPNEEDFREFLNTLLLCKARMQALYGNGEPVKLPVNDYKRIQHYCLTKDIPHDLVVDNEVSSTHCAKIINTIALKISQNAHFKEMVGSVIGDALRSYENGRPNL